MHINWNYVAFEKRTILISVSSQQTTPHNNNRRSVGSGLKTSTPAISGSIEVARSNARKGKTSTPSSDSLKRVSVHPEVGGDSTSEASSHQLFSASGTTISVADVPLPSVSPFKAVLPAQSHIPLVPKFMKLSPFSNKVHVYTVPLFGYETPVCSSHTCKGGCNAGRSRSAIGKCMCDSLCMIYGDCCWDYEWECLGQSSNNLSMIVANSKSSWRAYEELLQIRYSKSQYYECFEILTLPNFPFNVYGITSCPQNAPADLKMKCENVTAISWRIDKVTPVFVNETLYRNIYCAVCHGKKKEQIEILEPKISCLDQSVSSYNLSSNVSDMVAYLLKSNDCVLHFFLPYTLRRNLYCAQYVSDCPDLKVNFTRVDYQAGCKSHAAVFYHDKVLYKNIFCAVCNNMTEDFTQSFTQVCLDGLHIKHPVPPRGPDYFPVFTLLLDFSKEFTDYDIAIICKVNQVKGPDGKCHDSISPRGLIRFGIRLPLRRATDRLISGVSTQDIYYQLITEDTNTKTSQWKFKYFLSNVARTEPTDINYLGFCRAESVNLTCLTYNSTSNHDLTELNTFFESVTINTFHIKGVRDIVVSNYNESQMMDCMGGHVPEKLYMNWSDLLLHVNKSMDHNIGFSLKVDQVSGKIFRESWLLKCRSCPLVELKKEWYMGLNNSVKIIKTSEIIEDKYLIRKNAKIFLCLDLFTKLFSNDSLDSSTDKFDLHLQGTLTLVGQTLSMTCLGLTLIVYSLLPSLRTLPGKGIMNLCSALFLAQLLFQINPRFTPWQTVCHVVGVLQHFFWLSAFTWMSALAFTSALTFSRTRFVLRKDPHFVKYMVFAWGSPAVLVSVSVAVDHFVVVNVQYASTSTCWINDHDGLLYFFVIPLGFLVLINILLFAITVVGLRKTTKAASSAKSQEQCRKSENDCFLAYLKMSSIMGFGWILGFLAIFTKITYLWYVFIILSSSQGVFIFCSFVANRKVVHRFGVKYNIKLLIHSSESSGPKTTNSTRATSIRYLPDRQLRNSQVNQKQPVLAARHMSTDLYM